MSVLTAVNNIREPLPIYNDRHSIFFTVVCKLRNTNTCNLASKCCQYVCTHTYPLSKQTMHEKKIDSNNAMVYNQIILIN
jgi:hypothetical protein